MEVQIGMFKIKASVNIPLSMRPLNGLCECPLMPNCEAVLG